MIVFAGCLSAVCLNKIVTGLVEVAQAFAGGWRPHVFVNPDMRELSEGFYGMRIVLALAIFDFLCCMTEKRYTMSMFACSIALLVLTVLTIVFRPYTLDYVASMRNTLNDAWVLRSMIPVAVGEGVTLAVFAVLAAVYILSKARMRRGGAGIYHADAPANAFRRTVFCSLTAAIFAVCIIRLSKNFSILFDPINAGRLEPMNMYVVSAGDGVYLVRYVLSLTVFDFLCCWTKKAYTMSMFACSIAIFTLLSLTVFLYPAIEVVMSRVYWGKTFRQEFWGEVSLLAGMGVLLAAYVSLAVVYTVSKARVRKE